MKVTEEELKFLGNKSTKWFCQKCTPEVNEVLKNLQQFKDAGRYVKDLEEKLESRLKKVEELQVKVPNEEVNNSDTPTNARDEVQMAEFKSHTAELLHNMARDNLLLTCSLDAQEQYERRDTVIVHNVRERGRDEDLHQFALELCAATGGRVSPVEISVVHRLGRPRPNVNRPVIIKFTRRWCKAKLMENKHLLRKMQGWYNVYVEDGLTNWRRDFVSKPKRHDGVEKVTTKDGKIRGQSSSIARERFFLNEGKDFIDILDAGVLDKDFLNYVGLSTIL